MTIFIGPAGDLHQVITEGDVHERSFTAKVIADEPYLENYFLLIQAEPFCEMLSIEVGLLSRRPDQGWF